MQRVLEADDASFEAHVVESGGPVLVDFSAAWCGPCKRLEPLIADLAAEYEGRLKVVRVDVDRAPATAARFGVLSVPTLLLFRDGQVRDQLVGPTGKRAIAERIDRVL
jgi:thioredoxin 1